MKKLYCILMSIVISVSIQTRVFAAETVEKPPFDISAQSGILMNQTTGSILYTKNAHKKLAPASVTKIMTLLIVMEALENKKINLTDMVTTSTHASSMGGSQIWLKEHEQMSVNDLIKATAISSANDAATALAEFIAGSEENFVKMMNDKCKELSMNNTNFVNPTGLDAPTHLSTAYDIALMSKELLKYEDIKTYTSTWMDSLRDGKTELVNTNKLVRFYDGCTGLKTGTTDDAGSCVSVSATRNNMELIAVIMGAKTSAERFESARQLLDFGFSNFSLITLDIKQEEIEPIAVKSGIKKTIEPDNFEEINIVVKKGQENDMKKTFTILDEIVAPVKKGQILGYITVTTGDSEIAKFNITAKEEIPKLSFNYSFKNMLENVFN